MGVGRQERPKHSLTGGGFHHISACMSRQCDRKCNGQKIATASAEVHGSGRVSSATCGVSEKSNAVNSASLLREEEMRGHEPSNRRKWDVSCVVFVHIDY